VETVAKNKRKDKMIIEVAELGRFILFPAYSLKARLGILIRAKFPGQCFSACGWRQCGAVKFDMLLIIIIMMMMMMMMMMIIIIITTTTTTTFVI
jgi:hypothetical protein